MVRVCMTITLSHVNANLCFQSLVLGVIVLARNGDRLEYYQNPNTYAGAFTETTPLGEVCPVLICNQLIVGLIECYSRSSLTC